MASYEKMNRAMVDLGFPQPLIERVNAGYNQEAVRDKALHAAFLRRSCEILDEAVARGEIPFSLYRDLMDANACCKTGKRLKAIRALGREMAGRPLPERIQALAEVQYMIAPQLDQDGTLLTEMHCTNGRGFYCSCGAISQPQTERTLSKSYCMCCAGHFRFHYQKALGIKLELVEVISSPLATLGKEPFRARFRIVE